jgi:hypothetical protein
MLLPAPGTPSWRDPRPPRAAPSMHQNQPQDAPTYALSGTTLHRASRQHARGKKYRRRQDCSALLIRSFSQSHDGCGPPAQPKDAKHRPPQHRQARCDTVGVPSSSSTTPNDYILHSAISAPCSSKVNTPSRRCNQQLNPVHPQGALHLFWTPIPPLMGIIIARRYTQAGPTNHFLGGSFLRCRALGAHREILARLRETFRACWNVTHPPPEIME